MSDYTYQSYSMQPSGSTSNLNPLKSSGMNYLNTTTVKTQIVNTPIVTFTSNLNTESTRNIGTQLINLPAEDLQVHYVLLAAETERLIIMTSLMEKETENWRKKYFDQEKLISAKVPNEDALVYKKKCTELEQKIDEGVRKNWNLEQTILKQEKEISDLKISGTGAGTGQTQKDREVEYWKNRVTQNELEYQAKIQSIKLSAEGSLRQQIETEIRAALSHYDNEKKSLQARIEALQFERDQLTNRGSTGSNQDVAFWKEKYINLEASLDSIVKTSTDIKIKEAVAPLEREKTLLIANITDLEGKVKGLMKENNLLNERLRGFSEIEVRLQESLRIRDSLESQKVKLQESIRFQETKLREYEFEIEKIKRTVGTGDNLREKEILIQNLTSEIDQLSRKCRTLEAQNVEELDRRTIEIERTVRSKMDYELKRQVHDFEGEKAEYEATLDILRQKFADFEGKMVFVIDENEKLKALVAEKEREVDYLRYNQKYEKEAQDLKKQIRFFEEKLQELEQQAQKENPQLLDVIRQKEAEVELWKQKYHIIEQETQTYIDNTLSEVEVRFRQRIEQEKTSHASKVLEEKAALERELLASKNQLREKDQEILHLSNNQRNQIKENEVESLRIQLSQQTSQSQKQAETIKDLEVRQILFFIEIERLYVVNGEFIEEINRISHEINSLMSENELLQSRLEEANTAQIRNLDIEKYERTILELKEQVEDYDNRNRMLIAENSRLSDASHSRVREIESLKRVSSTGNLQMSPVKNMRRSQADFEELNMRLESNKGKLEAQIAHLKQTVEQNNKEMKKLQEINNQRKEENEELHSQKLVTKKLEQMKKDLMNIQQSESEVRFQQDHFNQLLKEIDEMKKARNFYRQQYEQVSLKLKEVYNDKINSNLPKQNVTITTTAYQTESSNYNSRSSNK